jgi:hypothetical protein
MKSGMFAVLAAGVVISSVAVRAADDSTTKPPASPEQVVYDAASAFELLKTLAGDWERTSADLEHGSAAPMVNIRVAAAGSAIVETYYAGLPHEMITVYHRDGDELLLTHYCSLQNAPVLKFEPSGTPGEIKFVFQGGTNFDPAVDAHVHAGVMRIKDRDTIEASYTSFANGEAGDPGVSTLRRKTAP